jgi:hypothetical protein
MGATLEGRIAKVVKRGPGVKREEIDLRFLRIPCPGDDSQEITPILVAMHGPKRSSEEDALARQEIMSAFASLAGAHTASPAGRSAPAPVGALAGKTGTLGGRSGFTPVSSDEEPIRVGEVRDYPSVKLSLPTLTSDPTILTSGGELLFDPDARFVIVLRVVPANPSRLETARAASSSAAAPAHEIVATAPAPPPPAPAPVLVENCVSGGCVTAPDAAPVAAERAQAEIPLRALSYRPRTARTVIGGLEDESAVAFLGNDQIFITFNTHSLVHRSESEAQRSSSPRQIRGVLVSAVDGRRLQVVDWSVPDQRAYLWPLDQGRLLVHVSNALVVYGPNLEEQARWQIPGPLLFVTVSPSRALILAAVEHEKYDAATFRRLADFIGSTDAVHGDCDLIALNSRLEPTNSHRLAQAPLRPALLDSGIISLVARPRSLWKIELTDWQQHARRLAEFSSGCTPLVQTLPAGLIFVSGCQADSSGKWYRMLRADGKTLLRGTSSNGTIPEYVDASFSGSVFAVGVEHAIHNVDWNSGMHIADLNSMTVAVYRASDGKRIYATKVQSHAVDRRVFALSDSGERLAILSDDSLRIYRTAPTP